MITNIDPSTGLAIVGAAVTVSSKDLVTKLLGPTADYIGDGLKSWTEKRVHNIDRIFSKACTRLGNKLDDEGSVPVKVLKTILDDGSFCEDDLAADYFAGVLASSRSTVSRDDRGASFAALVGQLTTYQIRSHYLFYTAVKMLFGSSAYHVTRQEGRNLLGTFIPFPSYWTAMEFTEKENMDLVLHHVMFGLAKEGLIDSNFNFGNVEFLNLYCSRAPETFTEGGIVFTPSPFGVELFLWANGMGNVFISDFLKPEISIPVNTEVAALPECEKLRSAL